MVPAHVGLTSAANSVNGRKTAEGVSCMGRRSEPLASVASGRNTP